MKLKKLISLVSAVVICLSLAACGKAEAGTAASGNADAAAKAATVSVTLAESWEFTSGFYPVITASNSNNYGITYWTRNFYNTLVCYDENGAIQGELAEKWNISDDGLTYTFTLRDGVKFSDGTPLTAEAVKNSMALAVLWVVPFALALVVGSKRIQDKMGLRNILIKRASADAIQECLETVRDIKACNQKERYLSGLREKLIRAEKSEIRVELGAGVFVVAAQAFLRLGIATTVLVGAGLLTGGEIDLLTFLVFLITAARLYDPLSLGLQNTAATFNAKLQINRMREIEEQPVQTGAGSYSPNGYDIVFDHDTKFYLKLFAYTFQLSAFTFGGGYVIVPLMTAG